MKHELVTTNDGSHTLFVPKLNEHYHSVHGAINESRHVFIQNGLIPAAEGKPELNILEIGFGTGLNTLLTVLENLPLNISYTTLEPFPLEKDVFESLNYGSTLRSQELFFKLHEAKWNEPVELTKDFELMKSNNTIQQFSPTSKFDLVYFDAFAPEKQPEMWELSVFEKIYHLMKPKSALVTYCAKGVVKRTLKAAGFKVQSLPGPPGKREMTMATSLPI